MGQKVGKDADSRPRVLTTSTPPAKSKKEEEKEVATKLLTARDTHSLDLQTCGLRTLPPPLFELTELMTLNLSTNLLKELDDGITKLVSLSNLKLNGNKLNELPDLHHIPSLEVLDVGKNAFTMFPSNVCEIKTLVRFIAHCNRFTSLPSGTCVFWLQAWSL